MIRLPDHPQRAALNDEVHARPPEPLAGPLRISYIALLSDDAARVTQAVADLAAHFSVARPSSGARHWSAQLGTLRVRWERHAEFDRYMFVAPGVVDHPFASPAIAAVPPDWLAALPGRVVMAAHVAMLPASPAETPDHEAIAAQWFDGHQLVGGAVLRGRARALTDFRIHADGFGRILVIDGGMTPPQAGRIVQRLLEIDTYRMLALLALPVARDLGPFLTRCEGELAQIAAALVGAGESDEGGLLGQLTRLSAEIESRDAETRYRFSAAAAYHDLVRRRIAELREDRIEGLQTIDEFIERRLAPAMGTCRATAARQEALAERVMRATQLLSTRVEVTRERQNQAMLESLDRRARMQLRLQETVEGLSVVVVTYYVVGLLAFAAKGGRAIGLPLDADMAAAAALPFVLLAVALGMRRFRRHALRHEE